jgi:hypothetical protein
MTSTALTQEIRSLAEVDDRIARTPHGPLTLDPKRESATPLRVLVDRLSEPTERPHLAAMAVAVAEAQLESFPENLFWDFDFYLASTHAQARDAADYGSYLDQVTAITVALMRMYGHESTIRFRYVHDFIYGFDWARWVGRGPEERSGVGPFSLTFLKNSERRGRDILGLIEADDAHYPKLGGDQPRNPFPFHREPEAELRLYRRLAERGAVPVRAWCAQAEPDASRDFDSLREEAARDLGLGR